MRLRSLLLRRLGTQGDTQVLCCAVRALVAMTVAHVKRGIKNIIYFRGVKYDSLFMGRRHFLSFKAASVIRTPHAKKGPFGRPGAAASGLLLAGHVRYVGSVMPSRACAGLSLHPSLFSNGKPANLLLPALPFIALFF